MSPLYIENGANCDCASLEQTQHVDGSSSSEHDSFLVAGRRRGDRLILEFIQPFSRRSKELRRAVRAIRRTDVCDQAGVVVDLGRSRGVEAGRMGEGQTRRRPRKHREEAVTTETTTTTTSTTTATTENPARIGGRSRNRQPGSRRNRGRNRDARQRARASRREREHQGRH